MTAGILVCCVQAAVAPAPEPVAEAYFLFLQARQLEQDGKIPDAVAALRRAAVLLPKVAEIHAELAGIYAREGRAADAVNAAEAALAIDADNREAHRILGFVKSSVASDASFAAQSKKLLAEAIRHLEQALSADVIDLSTQFLLSRTYAQAGLHDKAVVSVQKFLNAEPGYPEALLLLAESAERVDRWEDAADAWSQIIEMGPRGRSYRGRQAVALVRLGDQYFALKKYKDAADAFDRALAGDRTAFDAAEVLRKRDRARELAGK